MGIATLVSIITGTVGVSEAMAQKIHYGGLECGYPDYCRYLGFLRGGQSAEVGFPFPLHVWLPGAMEGPTPASTLIHAATMVAAGVCLLLQICRNSPRQVFPWGLFLISRIITAFMAASNAVVQNDLKKILAYSPHQPAGLGSGFSGRRGCYTAGVLFRLMTHAFKRPCLPLVNRAVIHSTSLQDIRQMGGL